MAQPKLWSGPVVSPAAVDTHFGMAKRTLVQPRFRKRQRRRTFLREWRKYRNLTLEAAADRAGMTAGNLSAMERGVQNYTQAGLEALADAYSAEPGWLLNVDPTKGDAIWSLWENALPAERERVEAVVRALIRTGTGGT